MIVVRRYTDGPAFARLVSPFLLRHEALNNLAFRIVGRFTDVATPLPSDVYLAAAFASAAPDADLVGVALRTLPFNLVLAVPCGAAVEPLVADAISFAALPGIVGDVADAAAGAAFWAAATGGTFAMSVALRIHELTRVEVVPGAGVLRPAEETDAPRLAEWEQAFYAEALPNETHRRGAPLNLDGLHVWEVDGKPVTMARGQATGPNSATITAVYTPPVHRSRGYATSAVAALSELLLRRGHRSCVLFTDLANPTSNAIYRRIGYRPAGDFSNLVFHAKP